MNIPNKRRIIRAIRILIFVSLFLCSFNLLYDEMQLGKNIEARSYDDSLNSSSKPDASLFTFNDALEAKSVTPSLVRDLPWDIERRRQHVEKVCHAHHMTTRNETNQPNAWEFIVSDKYRLTWCSIFKAASSTWLHNFGILAGYTEATLHKARKPLLDYVRIKYPRINVTHLDEVMNDDSYLSFMITRHPFERLVSGFRDKLERQNVQYRSVVDQIHLRAPIDPQTPINQETNNEETNSQTKSQAKKQTKKRIVRRRVRRKKFVPPLFWQFVKYLLDKNLKGERLDEHWTPMSTFCTPCLVNFDVFAKFESLSKDGNFIIHKKELENILVNTNIRINQSKKGPTKDITADYICPLPEKLKLGLIELYKLDFELFEYDYTQYLNCSSSI